MPDQDLLEMETQHHRPSTGRATVQGGEGAGPVLLGEGASRPIVLGEGGQGLQSWGRGEEGL